MRILINRPDGIGDQIITLPFILAVRRMFKTAEIFYNIGRRFETLIDVAVDKVIKLEQINYFDYDIVYDLRQSAINAFKRYDTRHQLDIFLDEFNLSTVLKDYEKFPSLTIAKDFGKHYFSLHNVNFLKPIIGIIVTSNSSIKDWPSYYLIKFLELANTDFNVIILNYLKYNIGNIFNAIDASGILTLKQAASIIAAVDIFIAPDTGLFHVAGALNIPTIGLFGPTPSLLISKYHKNIIKLLQAELICSPCWERGYKLKCNSKCMFAISPELLFYTVKSYLNKGE